MKEVYTHGKEIDLEELKVLQMDVLQAIDDFCEDNSIRYSLACGTLLGAVRHKGYIPWDDDIDIYVPREDYNRLLSVFPETYKERYKLISLERNAQWTHPYAKAYDNNTLLEENARNEEIIGVNIDIFPVDEVPAGNDWLVYNKKRRRLLYLFSLKFVRLSRHRSISKNCLILLFRLLTFFYSTRKWAERIDGLAQENNGKGYDHLFECCQGLLQKQPFAKSLFDSLVYIPFENRQFKAFADSDIYLRNGFGDYMQLPPIEKRISHHDFKAYWKI